MAAMLRRAIDEHGLPNRFTPAELAEWYGPPTAEAIAIVGVRWMGDLVEAFARPDIDLSYYSKVFTVRAA